MNKMRPHEITPELIELMNKVQEEATKIYKTAKNFSYNKTENSNKMICREVGTIYFEVDEDMEKLFNVIGILNRKVERLEDILEKQLDFLIDREAICEKCFANVSNCKCDENNKVN